MSISIQEIEKKVDLRKKSKKLITRQYLLKEYLKKNFVSGKFFTIEEIVEGVKFADDTPCYVLNTDPKVHDKCIILSKDVKDINWNNTQGYKVIVKNNKGSIKLAESKAEFDKWWQEEHDKIEVKYQYLNRLKDKVDRDGEILFVNQNNRVLEEEEMKPVEVFYKGEKN